MNTSIYYGQHLIIPIPVISNTQLSFGAKVCYGVLLHFTKKGKDFKSICNPSNADISEFMGVSEKQIGRYIKELSECELITVTRRGLGKPNEYTFTNMKYV